MLKTHKNKDAIFAYRRMGRGDVMYPRIRDLREDKDLSQHDLAKLLHVSQTTYSRYETGKLDIPTSALIALAKFYHVSVDYLLGLE